MNQPLTEDRRLALRTLAGALLMGLMGLATAWAIVDILARVAMPAMGKYVKTVRLAEEMGRLADRMGSGGTPFSVWVALAMALPVALLFPFLFNPRWFSRRILTLAGVGKVLGTMVLLGVMEATMNGLTGLLFGNSSEMDLLALGRLHRASDLIVWFIITSVGVTLFLVLCGELTLGGEPDRLRNPRFSKSHLRWAILSGLALGAAQTLMGGYLMGQIGLLMRAGLEFLGELGEVSALGWDRLRLGIALALGLSGAFLGGALIALAPVPAKARQRALALGLAVVPAVVLLAVGTWFQGYCMNQGEMKHAGLAAAAGLEPGPAEAVVILPAKGKLTAEAYPLEVRVSGFSDNEVIGATKRNLERVKEYLQKRQGRWTMHTIKAWGAGPAIHNRLFEPERAIEAQMEMAQSTSSLLATMLLVARVPHMPSSEATRHAIDALLDPARFVAGPGGRVRLADLALAKGDLAQAQRLWDEAVAEGYEVEGDRNRPEELPFREGSIVGRVELRGRPLAGARVALFHGEELNLRQSLSQAIRLVAATSSDKDGGFAFRGLRADTYEMAILVPPKADLSPIGLSLKGRLGPFALTKESPRAEAEALIEPL